MFRKEQPEVLVAGAGPVGMFVALRLAEQGVRVEIVDEAWNRAARSYALALHPSSLTLLDAAEAAAELLRAGQRIDSVSLYDRHRRRADLRLSELPGDFPFALVLAQSTFERALERRLAANGVRIRWNHRLARLDPGGDHVAVEIEKLGKESTGYGVATTEWVIDKTLHYSPAFVVGTDGHRSTVRRALAADFAPAGRPQLFAVFEFAADDLPWHDVRVVLDDESDNVLWSLGDGRFRASFEIEETGVEATARRKERLAVQVGNAAFPLLGEGELESLLEERAPWFDAQLGEIAWSVVVRFDRRIAEPFGQGRVWLAGDAGHLAAPIGVQSMNVGLSEADDLAGRLAAILRQGGDLELLAAYGAERRRAWRNLLGLEPRAADVHTADDWVGTRVERLLATVPASGDDVRRLLAQVGIELAA